MAQSHPSVHPYMQHAYTQTCGLRHVRLLCRVCTRARVCARVLRARGLQGQLVGLLERLDRHSNTSFTLEQRAAERLAKPPAELQERKQLQLQRRLERERLQREQEERERDGEGQVPAGAGACAPGGRAACWCACRGPNPTLPCSDVRHTFWRPVSG